MRKLFLLAAVLLALVLALTGCGGSGPVGDTLDEGQRNILLGNVQDGGNWSESTDLYVGAFDDNDPDPETAVNRALAGFKTPSLTRDAGWTWTGPDAGGWYTYTCFVEVAPTSIATFVIRFRYFADGYRFEFEETLTYSDQLGIVFTREGNIAFSGDPFGLDPVHPVSGLHSVMMTAGGVKMGHELVLSNANIIELNCPPAFAPHVLVGDVECYLTWIFPGFWNIDHVLTHDVSATVPNPLSDTPTLEINGTYDNPFISDPVVVYHVSVSLY